MKKQQSGFTLIELVMVIVILGILAATALPKFADLEEQAELATLDGAAGALQSSAAILYGSNRGSNSWASILANTELDSTVDTSAGGCSGTLSYSGGTASRSIIINSTLCQ